MGRGKLCRQRRPAHAQRQVVAGSGAAGKGHPVHCAGIIDIHGVAALGCPVGDGLGKKQSGTTASSAESGASVSVYGKVSDFDYSSFDYSEGLDDNGHR